MLNTFFVLVSNAKDPYLIHFIKGKDAIDAISYDVLAYMSKELLPQLKLVCVTSTLGIFYVQQPALAYPLFSESSSKKKRPGDDDTDKKYSPNKNNKNNNVNNNYNHKNNYNNYNTYNKNISNSDFID